MRRVLSAAVAILLSVAGPAAAHRLDEYLQATVISLEKSRIQVELRLAPGVAVLPIVLENIDRNGDGVLSDSEQRDYAERVLRDVSLTIDGDRAKLSLVSTRFPALDDMKEGQGEIRLEFAANLRRNAPNRSLVFENHHLGGISAYLVNCLVPRDPDIRIVAQNRNFPQSSYRLDYALAGVRSDASDWAWLGAILVLLFTRLAWLQSRDRKRASACSPQP